jgi:hypothetical protein
MKLGPWVFRSRWPIDASKLRILQYLLVAGLLLGAQSSGIYLRPGRFLAVAAHIALRGYVRIWQSQIEQGWSPLEFVTNQEVLDLDVLAPTAGPIDTVLVGSDLRVLLLQVDLGAVNIVLKSIVDVVRGGTLLLYQRVSTLEDWWVPPWWWSIRSSAHLRIHRMRCLLFRH